MFLFAIFYQLTVIYAIQIFFHKLTLLFLLTVLDL